MIETAIPKKNRAAWQKEGTAVTATSASDAARQAGLDWSVSLHEMNAVYSTPTSEGGVIKQHLPIDFKQAVVKTTPDGTLTPIGVVGSRYKVFQNAEIFSSLDSLIDSGQARYAAAGEYDNGAKVWMLLELPLEINIANDPHTGFLLAKTSHDGSSSVIIKPVIERLWCMNQINKVFRNKNKHTYTLSHTINAELSVSNIRDILNVTYEMADMYQAIGDKLIGNKVETRQRAVEYFKKVWPLPTTIENADLSLLSKGEKTARTRAFKARQMAMNIYEESETQENIRGTEFGLWHAVVEYTDHHSNSNAAIATLAERNDGIKMRSLALLGMVD